MEDLPKVDGFYPLFLREPIEVVTRLYGLSHQPPAPLLDFLGVSHINAPKRIFDWDRRDSFMPLVTAGQAPVFAQAPETLEVILRTNWNPRAAVYLPSEAKGAVQARGAGGARVLMGAAGAHKVDFEVETPARALVVVAQAYYRNWRAYVDDQPVPLWRANYAFQALEVPAGRHRVRLAYEDHAFRVGAVVSMSALALCAVGWRASRNRRASA
jgi:hypothetical protein